MDSRNHCYNKCNNNIFNVKMRNKKPSISLMSIDRIMRNAGAEKLTKQAKETLRDFLEDKAREITRRAKELAIHAGRKTIDKEDVKLAVKV